MDLSKQKEPGTRNCVQTQSGGGDGGIRTHVPISRQNDFESCAEKDFPEKSRSERVSLSLNFGRYTEPFRREKAKNGVGTNEMGNASFEEIWHIFLEKCKISCKIIQARFPLWLLVFCHPARRSLFPNARFKEDFLYY